MRIVFMGTPDFAVPALTAIHGAGHEIAAVVTQPDKPKGRGHEVLMTPVKEKALSLGIPVYQPQKAKEPEFVEQLKAMAPDVIVVAAFGQLLPRVILDIPRIACVNIHSSLLPKFRGAAPIQFAVIYGEERSGVTTMKMAEKMDTGDILEQESILLDEKETGGSLHDKLSEIGGRLILSTLTKLEEGSLVSVVQDESNATYVGKITKEMGDIDWSMGSVAIERLIRGLNPWPSAYTSLDGKIIKIWDGDVLDGQYTGCPGQIVGTDKDSIIVKTGDGAMAIRQLQLQGKKRMDTASFLRGFEIPVGTVLERSN